MSTTTTQPTGLGPVAEGSMLGRLVALLSPVFAIGAGWIAGLVSKFLPGVQLDQAQVSAFMLTGATAVMTATWKWLQGWQQHECLVANQKALPRKIAKAAVHTRRAAPDRSQGHSGHRTVAAERAASNSPARTVGSVLTS